MKEVNYTEMMSAINKAVETGNHIKARVIFKKGAIAKKFDTVAMRTFEFSSAEKMFGDYWGYSCFAKCKGIKDPWDSLIRIERSLSEENVALCYVEDKYAEN